MNHWITLSVWRRPTFNKFLKWGESIVDVKPISEVGIKFGYARKASMTCTTSSTVGWMERGKLRYVTSPSVMPRTRGRAGDNS